MGVQPSKNFSKLALLSRREAGLRRTRVAPLLAGLALSGCMVGPDYVPPPVVTPEEFKELKANLVKGWKLAAPRDSVDAGPWWRVYNDPTLDALEAQVELS